MLLEERLLAWADSGDMGRPPDPSDMRRQAAATLKRYREALEMIGWHIRSDEYSFEEDYFCCRRIARQALEEHKQ